MRFRSVFSVFHRFQTIHAASGPVGYFDGMTTYSILFPANAEFLESKGADFGAVTPDSILYNGCYILSSLVPSQEVRFDANPNYYDADNVKVQHVVVTYTNAEDPAQGFNMFVNGEVSSARINASLPDVVAKANELYPDNQFKSLTTATSYWGAFNWDRRLYALYNDPSVSTTSKTTEEQKNDTRTAILNANFRRAVYAAYSAHAVQAITNGEENADDTLRNTLVPYTFATTSDGRSYGAIVTKYVEELVPEYGDPLTYIHCFDIHDGDMLNYSGINYESQGQDDEQKAVLKAIGLEDIQAVVDEAAAATGYETDSGINFGTLKYKSVLDRMDKKKFNDNYADYEVFRNQPSMIGTSFIMGLLAMGLAYLLGLPIGVLMARRKDKLADKLGMIYIIFIIAVPSLAYIYLFRYIGTTLFNLPSVFTTYGPGDVRSWILPVISLALPSIANLMLWTRRYVVDQMSADYVKFAKAKGLNQREIFNGHIFKNAVIPIAQGIPTSLAGCITGAIITEAIYSVGGMGKMLPSAIKQYNNVMIVALAFLFSTVSVLSVLAGDIVLTKGGAFHVE